LRPLTDRICKHPDCQRRIPRGNQYCSRSCSGKNAQLRRDHPRKPMCEGPDCQKRVKYRALWRKDIGMVPVRFCSPQCYTNSGERGREARKVNVARGDRGRSRRFKVIFAEIDANGGKFTRADLRRYLQQAYVQGGDNQRLKARKAMAAVDPHADTWESGPRAPRVFDVPYELHTNCAGGRGR
jgi:hypothetical protein